MKSSYLREMIQEGQFHFVKILISFSLSEGKATSEEQQIAADILMGKIKAKRGRQGRGETQLALVIFLYQKLLEKDWPRDSIPMRIGELLGLSEGAVKKRLTTIRKKYGSDPAKWKWDELGVLGQYSAEWLLEGGRFRFGRNKKGPLKS